MKQNSKQDDDVLFLCQIMYELAEYLFFREKFELAIEHFLTIQNLFTSHFPHQTSNNKYGYFFFIFLLYENK